MAEAPTTDSDTSEKMKGDIPAAYGGDSPLALMRDVARKQAVKARMLVEEATELAKASGEDVDVVLERMILARLEEKSSAVVQARVAHASYMDAYDRLVLVGNGIHKADGIKKDQIVERLAICADTLKTSGETMLAKAQEV